MIAGIDYSTHAVDVVLLDEDTDAATWHRFELTGQDAFERARYVRRAWRFESPLRFFDDLDSVIAVGIEDPRGYNAGALYRIQGAILAELPRDRLVQPWPPSVWRKAVGLPGNASKAQVRQYVQFGRAQCWRNGDWPQDACDAYCIALATRNALQRTEAA